MLSVNVNVKKVKINYKNFFFQSVDLILAETVIDPVYETLKVAAETRKRTIANYLQQRQQTLDKQTSLNSQGSSELDIQPSPRVPRHNDATASSPPQASSLTGKQNSVLHFSSTTDSYQLSQNKK